MTLLPIFRSASRRPIPLSSPGHTRLICRYFSSALHGRHVTSARTFDINRLCRFLPRPLACPLACPVACPLVYPLACPVACPLACTQARTESRTECLHPISHRNAGRRTCRASAQMPQSRTLISARSNPYVSSTLARGHGRSSRIVRCMCTPAYRERTLECSRSPALDGRINR